MRTFIEIEKGSNLKYEYNRKTNTLQLDRVLPEPYVYPYAYGFIPNTLADDGDDLDVLVISNSTIPHNTYVDCQVVGLLEMVDEKGRDEKIIAIPLDEYVNGVVEDVHDLPRSVLETIHRFFSNYKSNDEGRWSQVGEYRSRREADTLINKCIVKYLLSQRE